MVVLLNELKIIEKYLFILFTFALFASVNAQVSNEISGSYFGGYSSKNSKGESSEGTKAYLHQTIQISLDKIPINLALEVIAKKTKISFSYSTDMLPSKMTVSVDEKNISVQSLLDKIFLDTNINWIPGRNRQVILHIDNKENTIEEIGTLRGIVVDSTNGEVLAFSNVMLKEIKRGASTDLHGYFIIPSVPANKTYTLLVSYVGYRSKEIRVYIAPNKITDVKIELSPTAVEMRAVEKVGQRIIESNATDIGLQRISIKDLESIPKGVETDVFRSIQSLPGVQSTGDVSARYYVRGSASNENLVLLDGVTLYNPFHALGIFSVIDPDLIHNVEFYKGGFTAEYGGRLSSVLNVITKDGNKNNFGASATSSFITGKALIEGPIPYGSFIIAGRKSYDTSILRKFLNNKNVPINFYDTGFKLNYSNPDFIKGSKFIIHGFASGDKLNSDDPKQEDINWSNKMFGLTWFRVTDSPLFYEMQFSWSNFDGDVNPKLSNVKPKSNTVNDISLNMHFNYIYDSKNELDVGLDLKDIDTKLLLKNLVGATSDIGSHGTRITVFGKFKLLQNDNFGLDIGSRLNLTSLSLSPNDIPLEPRISATYRLFPWLALKGAWGIYTQEMTTLSDENEVISLFEPWIISPPYLPAASAIHYTIGMKADISKYFTSDIQGYYKVLHNIPTVNDNKIEDSDPDLLPASGESYGWEFMLNYNKEPISLTASYSLAWAYKHLNGWTYYPRYDTRNAVNLIGVINLGSGWQFSAMWIYNTGRPFTQSLGYYDKLYFDDLNNYGSLLESYKPYSILADKNLGRLPEYHRLDVSLTKTFVLSWIKFDLDLSILNVYDRRNIFYFDRSTGRRINMLPFLPTATLKVEL